MAAETDPPQPLTGPAEIFTIHPRNQAVLAAMSAVLLLGLAIWYGWQETQNAGLVDLETAPPRELHLLVDINTAEWEEITLLPEVGLAMAQRIVAARQAGGLFRDPQDFSKRIRGVGPKTLEKMAPFMTGWQDATKR